MAELPRKTTRKDGGNIVKTSNCHTGQKIGEQLSPNQIRIQLPGRRYHLVPVKDDEKISSIKKKMADALGVKERNWGIYASQDNKPLEIIEDTKKINQINRNSLHFYPKIVIR